MITMNNSVNQSNPTQDDNANLNYKKTLAAIKPKMKLQRSNYDPLIPRKLLESICSISIGTLTKLENEGKLKSHKVRHGKIEMVMYELGDIKKVFDHKNVSFKKRADAEIISIFSQKGGVGKSAFTQHLASMLSLVGKVLVVDLDAQADATILFGIDKKHGDVLLDDDELQPTIAELMDWTMEDSDEVAYEVKTFSDVVKSVSPSLDLIPSDLELGEINYSLNRLPLQNRIDSKGKVQPAQLFMIREVFEKIKGDYDYIILDCPPNIETLNVSALFASNRIIIPLELEAKSLTIMKRNLSFLEKLRYLNNDFRWDKILIVPNKFKRENIKIKALAALEDKYRQTSAFDGALALSEAVIPNSSIIDKCSDWKSPIFSVTTRYGKGDKASISQAREFTNYFWYIMHEILDLPLERLIFDNDSDAGE